MFILIGRFKYQLKTFLATWRYFAYKYSCISCYKDVIITEITFSTWKKYYLDDYFITFFLTSVLKFPNKFVFKNEEHHLAVCLDAKI